MTGQLSTECRRVLASVSAYLDGDLDTSGCEWIKRHALQCQRCAEVIAGLRETVGLCREAGTVPIPDAVRQRARARVRRLLGGEQKVRSD
jgi:anti-sigma factor RsiW